MTHLPRVTEPQSDSQVVQTKFEETQNERVSLRRPFVLLGVSQISLSWTWGELRGMRVRIYIELCDRMRLESNAEHPHGLKDSRCALLSTTHAIFPCSKTPTDPLR